MDPNQPRHLDLKKDKGLAIEWGDGTSSYYSIGYLRKMSPAADARHLREQMEKNPLTILPSGSGRSGALVADSAELVGNYAIKIHFSDGHSSAIYSFAYLRKIDPDRQPTDQDAEEEAD